MKKKILKIEIDLSNAAFSDGGSLEVEKILLQMLNFYHDRGVDFHGCRKLVDSNGSICGEHFIYNEG